MRASAEGEDREEQTWKSNREQVDTDADKERVCQINRFEYGVY